MIFKKKTPAEPTRVTSAESSPSPEQTLIAASYTLKGSIRGPGMVDIEGRLEGDVDVQGRVTIHARASVQGEIKAEDLEIGGRVEGRLAISRQLNLHPTASFEGSAAAGRIAMAAGARLNGDVQMKA